MEIRKIKISPEVLKKEITTENYSGFSFGYYSGMSYILSAGTTNLGNWNTNPLTSFSGFLGGNFLSLIGPNLNQIFINTFDLEGYNWKPFLLYLIPGTIIKLTTSSGESLEFVKNNTPPILIEPSENDILLGAKESVLLSITPSNVTSTIPYGTRVNLTIIQPNTSQLIDLSIPILLKNTFLDVGYYSPFDGYISQLNEEINFLFSGDPIDNGVLCIYNTSNNRLNYLKDSTYTISWGDGTSEEITVFAPESICHDYNVVVDTEYEVSLTGSSNFGLFVVTKKITVPFTNVPITNPYGSINFISNNGVWSGTPTSQDYIYPFDSRNTVSAQVSSNFVSVPFLITGNTQSRLSDLKTYGPNPYKLFPYIVNLEDGTTGTTLSVSPIYTSYTVNDMYYVDFPDGRTVFILESKGFTSNDLTATTITKEEYLMNVIDQPQIQSYVFIERGKNSALENFRRIGEVNNTGSLEQYGYGFFDVRNYNEL
jgi:hypothetical protein